MTPRAKKAARALLRGEQVDLSGWPRDEILEVLDYCAAHWAEKLAQAKALRERVRAEAERAMAEVERSLEIAEQALAQLRELREQVADGGNQAG